MTGPLTCRIRSLPKQQHVDAAVNAVRENPANLPDGMSIDALHADSADRLAVDITRWWRPLKDLTVGFLDAPSRELRDRILLHMNAWGRHTSVRFHEVATDPLIRIGRLTDFDGPGLGGYWSALGTDITEWPADLPTLNLEGFTTATPDSEFYRVVRHEAGHTLGFPHEHMRHELVQRLDREKTIAYYLATEGWPEQGTVDQVLTPLEESSILGTPPEETSIMCYQIPGEITLDGVPILGGVDITESDHAFAALIYP